MKIFIKRDKIPDTDGEYLRAISEEINSVEELADAAWGISAIMHELKKEPFEDSLKSIENEEVPHVSQYLVEGGQNAKILLITNPKRGYIHPSVEVPDLPSMAPEKQLRIIKAPGKEYMSDTDFERLKEL